MFTIKSLDNNIVIDNENYNSDRWVFSIHMKNKYCNCPNCDNKTRSIHSFHYRKIQDLPIQNKIVYLNIRMRHMICRNCKTIFTQSLSFAENKSHMANRLKNHIMITSTPNSSLIAEKQLKMEGIKVKKSTICSLLKKEGLIQINKENYIEIGIDDFAIKKRFHYGTIMVDQTTKKTVDMIDTRDVNEVSIWLQSYSNLKLISRDGPIPYKMAIE